MRHLVVLNPRAGGGGRKFERRLRSVLKERRLEFEIATTAHAGHARELVAEMGSAFDAVVAAGGDGTLHEVLQTLDLDRHRLGVIPRGTGNDFAWMHHWPRRLEAAVDRIAAARETPVDVGTWRAETGAEILEGRFLNNIGLGFEATVNRESSRSRRLRGPLLYVAALIRSLPRFRSYPVRFSWDAGSHEGRVSLLDVGLGKRVGGCFLMTPGADARDGKMDVVWTRELSLGKVLLLAPKLFSGKHVDRPEVFTAQTSELSVSCGEGIPMYVDGEFLSAEVVELSAKVLTRALRGL